MVTRNVIPGHLHGIARARVGGGELLAQVQHVKQRHIAYLLALQIGDADALALFHLDRLAALGWHDDVEDSLAVDGLHLALL